MRYDIGFLVNTGPTNAQFDGLVRFLKIMDEWTEQICDRTDELFHLYNFNPDRNLPAKRAVEDVRALENAGFVTKGDVVYKDQLTGSAK